MLTAASGSTKCVPFPRGDRCRRRHVPTDRCRCNARHSGAGAMFSTTDAGAACRTGAGEMYPTTSAHGRRSNVRHCTTAQELRRTLWVLARCTPPLALMFRTRLRVLAPLTWPSLCSAARNSKQKGDAATSLTSNGWYIGHLLKLFDNRSRCRTACSDESTSIQSTLTLRTCNGAIVSGCKGGN